MEENKFNTIHKAIDNSDDEQAVIDLGFGRGFRIIDREEW